MRNILLSASLLVAVVVGIAALPSVFPPKSPTSGSTVLITIKDENAEPLSLGSGVDIGHNVIITARHVVDGAKIIEVERSDGTTFQAQVMWADEAHDVAAIQPVNVVELGEPHSALACGYSPNIGDAIEIVGNPLGFKFVHTFARVASGMMHDERLNKAWADAFLADGTVNPGNSGGPVFDRYGKVVGIAVGVLLAPLNRTSASLSGLSVIVPASTVCGLLKSHEETVS